MAGLNVKYLEIFSFTFIAFVLVGCNRGEVDVSSNFSGIVYEYATERPMNNIEVSMYAGPGVNSTQLVESTISNESGKFNFDPDSSDEIVAYFYTAEVVGFDIRPANDNIIAFVNDPPNYDSLIAYEDAYLKCVVNPIGDTNSFQLSVRWISEEFPFSSLNSFVFEDSDEVQSAVAKVFKTKKEITVSWIIDGITISEKVELLAQDTVSITIDF